MGIKNIVKKLQKEFKDYPIIIDFEEDTIIVAFETQIGIYNEEFIDINELYTFIEKLIDGVDVVKDNNYVIVFLDGVSEYSDEVIELVNYLINEVDDKFKIKNIY